MNEGIKSMWEREKETTKAEEYSQKQKRLRSILSLAGEGLIDGVSLCRLCFEYDLYYREYPEHPYEGLSLYEFFRDIYDGDNTVIFSHVWEDELETRWKKKRENEEKEECPY